MAFSRLPISDFDLSGITNEVNRWQKNNHFAHYDSSSGSDGRVVLFLQDPFVSETSVLRLDIWKYGEKRLIGWKKAWVAEIARAPSTDGEFRLQGYVGAAILAKLLTDSISCIRSGHFPFDDFGAAVNTYLLR